MVKTGLLKSVSKLLSTRVTGNGKACYSRKEGIKSEYKERTDTIQSVGLRAFLPRHKSRLEYRRLAGTWL